MDSRTFADRHPVALIIAIIDSCIVFAAAEAASLSRFSHLLDEGNYLWVAGSLSLLVVLCSIFSGLYESWRGQSKWKLGATFLLSWTLPFVILLVGLFFTKQAESFSRLWLISWYLLALLFGGGFRGTLYAFLALVRSNKRNSKTVFVVGDREQYKKIKRHLTKHQSYGYRVADHLSLDSESTLSAADKNAIISAIERTTPHEIWFCLPLTKAALVTPLLYTLRHSTAEIRYVPSIDDLPLLNHKANQVADLFTLDLSCSPLGGGGRLIKVLQDFVIGALISLLILPLCFLIALAVKVSSPGPVLFKQYRDGLNGKKIKVYKFRSMRVHQEFDAKVTQAIKGDERITKVGSFLRRTSLDELPQFLNVLQGRMSIVGPRPHALEHNEYYKDLVESYMRRHKVKPGITGWAQVNGFRGETDTLDKMQGRVDHDFWYIDNWSLWLDLKIIFWTVFKGFINKNAY